jgi:hypothetical protein
VMPFRLVEKCNQRPGINDRGGHCVRSSADAPDWRRDRERRT